MPRPYRPDYLPALTHIRQCIAEHGEEAGPKIARANFTKVDKGTWSRWCRQVREEDNLTRAAPTSLPAPVAASAALVGKVEPEIPGEIDFYEQVAAMLSACDALADYAWPRDLANGGRRLRNPLMLSQSIRMRSMVLDLWCRREESRYAAHRFQDWTAQIAAALVSVLDECQSEVERSSLLRLRQRLTDLSDQNRKASADISPRALQYIV